MLDVNWLTPAKRRQLVVVGEEGMFELDYLTQRLTFTRATDTTNPRLIGGYAPTFEGEVVELPVASAEPLASELDSFLGIVRRGGKPVVDAEDGLWAVAIATSLLAAAAAGTAIDLSTLSSRFAPAS
jgi:predicted dehydrogenase